MPIYSVVARETCFRNLCKSDFTALDLQHAKHLVIVNVTLFITLNIPQTHLVSKDI